jgi:putative phosphoesterase
VKIGVLSDTHDNLVNLRAAVAALGSRGIGLLLHAGDFCSPFTLAEFAPLRQRGATMRAVFGNNDGDRLMLARRGEGFCEFRDGAWVMDVEGRRIAMMHYPDLAEDLWRGGTFDLVIYGHDHRVRVEGTGRKLLNPGTGSGYLVGRATCAVVDTADMAVEIVELP